jgi:hypothetical protein
VKGVIRTAAHAACVLALVAAAQAQEPEVYEPPRDYGTDWRPALDLGYSTEDGILLGGGPILYGFAFRRLPYAYRMQLTGVVAPRTGAFSLEYDARVPAVRPAVDVGVHAGISTLDVRSYYGAGNESSRNAAAEEERFYRAAVLTASLQPELRVRLRPRWDLRAGASLGYTNVRERGDRYLRAESLAVLGDKRLTAGVLAGFLLDTRDEPAAARSGVFLSLLGRADAGFTGWKAPVQRASADLRWYVSPPGLQSITLALRAAGEKVWGRYPWFEAAFLGGQGSLRGFNRERFAGDASLLANVELRADLLRVLLLVPTGVSLVALADAGRVWADGTTPGTWHVGVGGGILVAPIAPSNTLSVSMAHSKDGFFVVAAAGAGF